MASHERAFGLLLRSDLAGLRSLVMGWYTEPSHSDDAVAARLSDPEDDFGPEDASTLVLSSIYHRGLGLVDSALTSGDPALFELAMAALADVVEGAATIGNIPTWWIATLTQHIFGDLWTQSLHVVLPSGPDTNTPARWESLRRDFIAQLSTRRPPHIELWPSQLAAATRSVDPHDDLVIALPTSAGKTRIAELCILRALADQRRVVYVTPLRALSAQVERILSRTFVPLDASVTSLYGASGATSSDVASLADASIVVATPEKLDFALRQDPDVINDVALIVFDEGHMIGLGSREIRYEVLIQRLLRRSDAATRRIVCLSAMFNPDDPYFADFGNWLRSDAAGGFVHVRWRPTRQRFATLDWSKSTAAGRLSFIDEERPYVPRFLEGAEAQGRRTNDFPQNDQEYCVAAANAFARDGHTILVYAPQRSQIEPLATLFAKVATQGYLSHIKAPQAGHLAVAQAIAREWLGDDHPAIKALAIGVGTHHAVLPRPFLSAIEELLAKRRLSVVVASPTLAPGVDLSCSVLIFRSLRRYEKGAWRSISAAEFSNVVGRVGRAFVDLDGITVLPTFETRDRSKHHATFENLVQESKGQRLLSGLAQLVWHISEQLSSLLSVPATSLTEYVLNHSDLWEDVRLVASSTDTDEDDETFEAENALARQLADLDVALLSLVEPLNADVEELADIVDGVLLDSLWKRTLAHFSKDHSTLERTLLLSRGRWLWTTTTASQREACFYSGLGKSAGLFIYEQLDELVDVLARFQNAVAERDVEGVGDAAVEFAGRVMLEDQFAIARLPEGWEEVLAAWVKGTAAVEILAGRKARDVQRVQTFLQDGAVFRLVWAAEAARVQAIATGHSRADELGDGPAFALTYGVPTISAALLCQLGFSSRVGALWVSQQMNATFTDIEGRREWLGTNDAFLTDPEFWPSVDQYLL